MNIWGANLIVEDKEVTKLVTLQLKNEHRQINFYIGVNYT